MTIPLSTRERRVKQTEPTHFAAGHAYFTRHDGNYPASRDDSGANDRRQARYRRLVDDTDTYPWSGSQARADLILALRRTEYERAAVTFAETYHGDRTEAELDAATERFAAMWAARSRREAE